MDLKEYVDGKFEENKPKFMDVQPTGLEKHKRAFAVWEVNPETKEIGKLIYASNNIEDVKKFINEYTDKTVVWGKNR